jgi:signal transduction histidine kinase
MSRKQRETETGGMTEQLAPHPHVSDSSVLEREVTLLFDEDHTRNGADPSTVGSTVLIADARPEAITALSPILTGEGYRILIARNHRIALDVFVHERADILIIHQDLLAEGGLDLIRRVRAMAPAVPIIVQCGQLERKDRRRIIRELDVNGIYGEDEDPGRILELLDCAVSASRCVVRVRAEQDVRGLILAKLCHNLRSPLHVIQGYTEVLRSDPSISAHELDDVLQRLTEATEKATGLVHDYLDLAHIDAPALPVQREQVDMDQMVAELRSLAWRQIGDKPVRLTTSMPLTGAFLYGDSQKLRVILSQLLANAIKFTPRGDIDLMIRSEADRTDFVLADRGPGISEQDLPLLLTPFRQLPDDPLACMPGQGIGLAIVHRLSALIGASVSVRRRQGGGTIFVLSVPGPLIVEDSESAGHTLH